MNPKDQRPIKQEIRRLERRLARLRERLKISDRNEVIALYDGDVDARIAVEADGLGGARVVRAGRCLQHEALRAKHCISRVRPTGRDGRS